MILFDTHLVPKHQQVLHYLLSNSWASHPVLIQNHMDIDILIY